MKKLLLLFLFNFISNIYLLQNISRKFLQISNDLRNLKLSLKQNSNHSLSYNAKLYYSNLTKNIFSNSNEKDSFKLDLNFVNYYRDNIESKENILNSEITKLINDFFNSKETKDKINNLFDIIHNQKSKKEEILRLEKLFDSLLDDNKYFHENLTTVLKKSAILLKEYLSIFIDSNSIFLEHVKIIKDSWLKTIIQGFFPLLQEKGSDSVIIPLIEKSINIYNEILIMENVAEKLNNSGHYSNKNIENSKIRKSLIDINKYFLKKYSINSNNSIKINSTNDFYIKRRILIHELGHVFGNISNEKYKMNYYSDNNNILCSIEANTSNDKRIFMVLFGLISESFIYGSDVYSQYSSNCSHGDIIIFQNLFNTLCEKNEINNKDSLLHDIMFFSNDFISKNYKFIEKIVDEELMPLIKNENFKSNILQNQFIEIEEQNENKDKFSISFNIDTNNSIIKTANNDLDIISKIINNNIQSGKYS